MSTPPPAVPSAIEPSNVPIVDKPLDGKRSDTTASPAARLAEAVGDRINPILVKETRQALKSRQFLLWFVLLLVASWIATLSAVAIIGPSIYYVSAGSYVLKAYYAILCVPLIVVAPFSAYRSLASEHEDNTRDLVEVSSLTPRQVINGKLGSAALQIIIYGSALAPCIAFTYLLRGVDLIRISVLLGYAVLASFGLSTVGLLLAAATRQKYAQVVMSVALAGGLFTAYGFLLRLAWQVIQYDASYVRNSEFWWVNAASLSLYVTTLAVAYAAAISLTTFTSANRSTPVRLALFLQQTVWVAWMAGLVAIGMPAEPHLVAFLIAAAYWFVAGAVLSGEQPVLSQRVRRSLPKSLLGRATLTWLQPGGGSGYAFAISNLISLALLACVPLTISGLPAALLPAAAQTEFMAAVGLATAYVVAYLGVGRLVVIGLRKVTDVPPLGAFLIQVLLALAGSGLPYVIDTLTDQIRVENLVWLNAVSPSWNFDAIESGAIGLDRILSLLVTVGAVALTVLLVNLVLAGHEARQVRSGKPKRVIEDDLEQRPAPEAKPTNPWGDTDQAGVDSTA